MLNLTEAHAESEKKISIKVNLELEYILMMINFLQIIGSI